MILFVRRAMLNSFRNLFLNIVLNKYDLKPKLNKIKPYCTLRLKIDLLLTNLFETL